MFTGGFHVCNEELPKCFRLYLKLVHPVEFLLSCFDRVTKNNASLNTKWNLKQITSSVFNNYNYPNNVFAPVAKSLIYNILIHVTKILYGDLHDEFTAENGRDKTVQLRRIGV